MQADIHIKNLTYQKETKQILDGVSFHLSMSRIGIIGVNGSGKTSLAKAICGLVEPDKGNVLINGEDVLQNRKAALKQVGILFQNPDHQIIFPTVEEELSFGLRQLGHSKQEAGRRSLAMLEKFNRKAWWGAQTHSLSQGQRQLLCLMAILLMQPCVIILDEPFTGLDIPTKMRLETHLRNIEATVVHITHDPVHLDGYDYIIWLEAGRVHQEGSPADVIPLFLNEMKERGGQDAELDLP